MKFISLSQKQSFVLCSLPPLNQPTVLDLIIECIYLCLLLLKHIETFLIRMFLLYCYGLYIIILKCVLKSY